MKRNSLLMILAASAVVGGTIFWLLQTEKGTELKKRWTLKGKKFSDEAKQFFDEMKEKVSEARNGRKPEPVS